MKSNAWVMMGLLFAVALAFGLGQSLVGNSRAAEPEKLNSVLRYQISAYAGVTPGGVHHGCYIVDTTTGQVWHAPAGGAIEKVSEIPR